MFKMIKLAIAINDNLINQLIEDYRILNGDTTIEMREEYRASWMRTIRAARELSANLRDLNKFH